MTGTCAALVYLALLLVTVGAGALAQAPPAPPEPVPAISGPPPSPQERLLSPIPGLFNWMSREVRPNPLLEALMDLREGAPQLFMSASLAEEYSDNFFQTERDRREGYRTSGVFGTVYHLEDGRRFVSLANSISANYEARSEQSHVAFANLSLNAGYQLPRVSLALSDSFIRSDTLDDATPSGLRRERRTFWRNSVSPQMRYALTPLTAADLAYTNTLVRNEDQDAGNTTSHAFTTGFQHRFSRLLQGSVRYTFITADTEGAFETHSHNASADLVYSLERRTSVSLRAFGTVIDRSAGGTDSRIYGASLGVRRQLTSFLSVFTAVGPIVLGRQGQAQRVFVNWQANLDGALPFPGMPHTSLTFSAQQNVNDTVNEVDNVGLVLRRSVTLRLHHAASRYLHASLFVTYFRTELLETIGTPESVRGRKDNFWNAGASVSYALTRVVSLSCNYQYRRRESNLPCGDFDENRLTLALSAGFPVF